MARYNGNMMDRAVAIQQMKDQRETIANADKANNEPFHGKAGRKWYSSDIADRGRMMSSQADMMETQSQMMQNNMLASEFDNIYSNAETASQNRARAGRVTRAAMYKNALKNGGFVHPSIMPAVNQQLGSNGQIVGGTIDEHGNFITMGRKGNKIVPIGITSAAEMVGDMVRDGGDMDVADAIVANLGKRMTKSQIRDLTGYTPERSQSIRQQQAADKEAASTAKIKLDAVKTFAEIMKGTDGKQPPSRQEFLLSMLTNRDVIARMFPEKIDDKGNPVGLTKEDWTKAATIINGMYGDAKNEATGTGGWRDQAAGAIASVLGSIDGGQRGVDPVSYWRGRQQAEDAKAGYIQQNRKFQDYYDKDGNLHTDQYVTAITDENGVKRMYDTEGNEMEGAMTRKDYEAKLAADQERLDAEVEKAKSEENAIREEIGSSERKEEDDSAVRNGGEDVQAKSDNALSEAKAKWSGKAARVTVTNADSYDPELTDENLGLVDEDQKELDWASDTVDREEREKNEARLNAVKENLKKEKKNLEEKVALRNRGIKDGKYEDKEREARFQKEYKKERSSRYNISVLGLDMSEDAARLRFEQREEAEKAREDEKKAIEEARAKATRDMYGNRGISSVGR